MKMLLIRASVGVAVMLLLLIAGITSPARDKTKKGDAQGHKMVIIPGEDRFTPFAITIRPGETVQWVNTDTDDHTVVSDDFFNSAGNQGTDHLLPGTDTTGGKPSTFTLKFSHPGQFVFYCKFHPHLDADHQPVAPGPRGGIQDSSGNFGTPMMGVVTVVPNAEGEAATTPATKH